MEFITTRYSDDNSMGYQMSYDLLNGKIATIYLNHNNEIVLTLNYPGNATTLFTKPGPESTFTGTHIFGLIYRELCEKDVNRVVLDMLYDLSMLYVVKDDLGWGNVVNYTNRESVKLWLEVNGYAI